MKKIRMSKKSYMYFRMSFLMEMVYRVDIIRGEWFLSAKEVKSVFGDD